MKPTEFETYVASLYEKEGYSVEKTPESGDYGVDLFATQNDVKIAIQVKMYGNSTRKINRAMVMELHGAMTYFDCNSAVIAYSGDVLPTAEEVAKKLKITLRKISESSPIPRGKVRAYEVKREKSGAVLFEDLWKEYIIPLKGTTLSKEQGSTNKIVDVDNGGITRITSKRKRGKISIEAFKFAYNKLLQNGKVTRDEINQQFAKGRFSSGVVLILSQVPFVTVEKIDGKMTLLVKFDNKN